jgi:hypothetical protein
MPKKGWGAMSGPSTSLPGWAARAHVRQLVQSLLHQVRAGGPPEIEFDRTRVGLAWLPLTTAEFATAVNRLANARSYSRSGEAGAACYELHLLLRSLEPVEPAAGD